MRKDLASLWGLIGGWAFLTLLLAFVIQARGYWGANPIVRQRIEAVEAFQMASTVEDSPDPVKEGMSPADSGLEKPRQPYTLLNDWLQPKSPEEAAAVGEGNPPVGRQVEIPDSRYGQAIQNIYKETGVQPRPAFNSQTCYESDFQVRLEKTGNFRQLTNNYKRESPDSCTAPNQEVALGYYKVEPVPFEGCIDRKEWAMN
jgi:hypothetical protein